MVERRPLQKSTIKRRELQKMKDIAVQPITGTAREKIKRVATSASGDNKQSAFGYGKPPRYSVWRPGRSGNPAGRPKGVRNFATEVKHVLTAPVKVSDEGAERTVSAQAAALMVLLQKAFNGHPQALKGVMDLGGRFNNEQTAEAHQALSADDEAILAAYEADIIDSIKAQIFASLKGIIESIALASGTSPSRKSPANPW